MATPTPDGEKGVLTEEENGTAFLWEVLETFHDKVEAHDAFTQAMTDFDDGRINVEGFIQKGKELFEGHNNLMLGFNKFLTQKYKIHLPSDVAAFEFAFTIKTRFPCNCPIRKSFVDIFNLHETGSKSTEEVRDQVSLLFKNHAELLDQFSHIAPESFAIVLREIRKFQAQE